MLVRRRRGSLHWLLAHHSLDFLQAHHLPGRRGDVLWKLCLLGNRRLLGLETPYVGTRFQLRDIIGIVIALVAGPGRLGSVGDGRLLLLGRGMASLIDHLLFLEGIGDLGGLAGEVEIAPNALLGSWAGAKGVVIEGIVGLVELVA